MLHQAQTVQVVTAVEALEWRGGCRGRFAFDAELEVSLRRTEADREMFACSRRTGSGRRANQTGLQHVLDRGAQAADGERLDEVGRRAQLEYLREGQQDAHAHDR